MAEIIYTALVSRIRKSLGGTTFSNWKGKNIIKQKIVHPRQPRTESQMIMRQICSYLASFWESLNEKQKAAWQQFGSQIPTPMSGLNAFIMVNSRGFRYLGWNAVNAAPPADVRLLPKLDFNTLVASSTKLTWNWTHLGATNEKVICEAAYQTYYNAQTSPRFFYANKADAATGTCEWTHGMPLGAKLWGRIFVITEDAMVGPNSMLREAAVPAPP